MRLPFRQGIVDAQKNGLGNPQFILPSSTAGYLQLSATLSPTTFTAAHGSSDYLFTFNQNVDPAWGPVVPGVNNHLYWDINVQTAAVTFGITTLEPVAALHAPSTPELDQHWFDLGTTTMKVWNGSKWQTKIRVFAGTIPNGNLSSNQLSWCNQLYVPWVLASQLQVESNPGYILTNIFGQPLYLSGTSFEFLTVQTPVRVATTVGTSGVLSQPANTTFPVKAAENIPAMSLVYFNGENTIGLASGNPAISPPKLPIGIVQHELMAGEMGMLHQSGEISFDGWDWSQHIGKPLYCGDYGTIVTYRPNGLLAYRIGFVKNRNTILFQVDAETLPQVYQAGPSDVVVNGVSPLESELTTNAQGERVWTLSAPDADASNVGWMTPTQVLQIDDHEQRLQTAETDISERAMLAHTHSVSDVASLQDALDVKAALIHTHDQYALVDHAHTQYAPIEHQHFITDVQGLQTALDGKLGAVAGTLGNFTSIGPNGAVVDSGTSITSLSTTFAYANHTQSIQTINGLENALAGKSPTGHTHTLNSLTDITATAPNSIIVYDGSQWRVVEGGMLVASQPIKSAPLNVINVDTTSISVGSAAHHHAYIRLTAPDPVTVVIAADETWTGSDAYWENGFAPLNPAAMPIGGTLQIIRCGGDVFIEPAPDVIVNSISNLLAKTFTEVTLIKIGENAWDMIGHASSSMLFPPS